MARALNLRSLLLHGLVAGLLLGGCAPAPTASIQTLHFAIGEHNAVQTPVGAEAPAAIVPNVGAAERDFTPVRLFGRAALPKDLEGAANVVEGNVSGSAVVVSDAVTGKVVGQAVSYYDGSFMVDIPLESGVFSALVSIELVDKTQPEKKIRMMAPVLLRAGAAEEQIVLTPGSTALVAFLTAIAAEQAGVSTPGEEMQADPQEIGPGRVTEELSQLIAVFEPATRDQFAMLAESSPELQQIRNIEGFQAGIRNYVGRLTRSPRTKVKVAL
jgi:hypothetical protein